MTLAERFARRVDKTPGLGPWGNCHEWRGSKRGGYGRVSVDGRLRPAHAVAFYLAHGRWARPMCLHSCDNPPCVRADHLFEGDQTANMADMVAKGRSGARLTTPPRLTGELHPRHKLTVRDVAFIRASSESNRTLAARFGVAVSTIHNARHGVTWQETELT